jgi:hypothetical protein
VFGVSTKGKITTKAKLIGRRSVAESEFLDDLIEFIVCAGGSGDEELFGFRKQDGSRTVLTARSVRDEMMDIASRNDLPPNCFSAHSLRKGSITHMRAQGVMEGQRELRRWVASNEHDVRLCDGVRTFGVEKLGRRPRADADRHQAPYSSTPSVGLNCAAYSGRLPRYSGWRESEFHGLPAPQPQCGKIWE